MEAMDAIKESIFRGDYAPGQALPNEKELAGMLGVSRPVVREALRVLQIQGFLDVRRGSKGGTYITDLSGISIKDNLEDLLHLGKISMEELTQARLHIEPEVFRLAALNASQAQIEALERLTQGAINTRSARQRIRLSADFHRLVAKASGSLLYARFMDTILEFVEIFILTIKPPDFHIHDPRDHAAICKAISQRDVEKTVELARAHAEQVTRDMIKLEKQWRKAIRK
jgi:DNA-binding FadR family transcriptional regulator